jgi:ketosteroid isomerase-like protein
MQRGDLGLAGLVGAFVVGVMTGVFVPSNVAALQRTMPDEETRRALAIVKNAIVAGHQSRDAGRLGRLYADDYTAVDSKGNTRTKRDLLDGLETDPEIVSGRYEIIAARRFGDVAVASGRGHLVYRNADGSTRLADYYSFNVFEHRDGRWVYAAAFLP